MKHVLTAAVAALALAALPALAAEANFDRNLTVNGRVELSVSTGSGHIHLTRSSGNQVQIHGHVQSNWGGATKTACGRSPPIRPSSRPATSSASEPTTVRTSTTSASTTTSRPRRTRFSKPAPARAKSRTMAWAKTPSSTPAPGPSMPPACTEASRSRPARATSVAEQTGEGDVKAQTGSGRIELKDIHGGLHAGTGSGDIKISGSPASDWRLETGSGSIEFSPGNTGFVLDASTGSGSVHTDHEMTVQGSFDQPPHHRQGQRRRPHGPHPDRLGRRPHPLTAFLSLFLRRGLPFLHGPRLSFVA